MIENSIVSPIIKCPDWFCGRSRFLGLNRKGKAVLIPLDLRAHGPWAIELEVLETAVADQVLKVSTDDPFRQRTYSDLSAAEKAYYDAWKDHLLPIISGDARLALLESRERARVIIRLAASTNRHANVVRRVIYSVLRAGCSLRGIMPRLYLRGGPGRLQRKGTARRGRKPLPDGIGSELAAPEIRRVLEDAVEEYVIKGGDSVSAAFQKLLNAHFSDAHTAVNGAVSVVTRPEAQLPTIRQFRNAVRDHKAVRRARFEAATAPRPGKAKDGVPGPGYRYEIDATGARLELVSEFDLGQAIGSANAYAVLDVWSTACVGGVLGVFNAGYEAAQRALFYSFTRKERLCDRYDIRISDDLWPCHHLPRQLLGDRGEIASRAAEALTEELNVDVLNTAAYRPQMKGTVERWFHGLKSGDIRKLVGYGRRPERGELDPRRRAALTRYDGMRAFLLLAIRYNHQPAPLDAIPAAMLESGYKAISRIALWQWGMANRVSGARVEAPGVIYTSLLRKIDAAIRPDGLYVRGVRYMSAELRTSGLLRQASATGRIDVQATIDEYASRVIWYRTDPDAPWLPASLADQTIAARDATFAELTDYYRKRNNVHARSVIASAALGSSLSNGVISISRGAVTRQGAPISRARNKGTIRTARAADAETERREHGAMVVASYVKGHIVSAPTPTVRARAESHDSGSAAAKSRIALARGAFLTKGT